MWCLLSLTFIPKISGTKSTIKNSKVPKDINALIKLYTHHKTYKQYSQAVSFVLSNLQVIAILSLNFPNLYLPNKQPLAPGVFLFCAWEQKSGDKNRKSPLGNIH